MSRPTPAIETLLLQCVGRAEAAALAPAVALIRSNQVVALPTETVYGLGANAIEEEAVKKIFAVKGRPLDNPLIVHVSSRAMLERIVDAVSPAAERLIEAFWPGPLTIIFPCRGGVISRAVTAGLPTVGVRMPSHPVALKLIELADLPIAAPSANLSGRPSPTRVEHVIEDLAGRVPCIIDGGPCEFGVESTVVRLGTPPVVLRPGAITLELLQGVVPEMVSLAKAQETDDSIPESPGMKYRHYSPRAPITLYEGAWDRVKPALWNDLRRRVASNEKVGLINTRGAAAQDLVPEDIAREIKVIHLGDPDALREIARGLFAAYRELDQQGVDAIVMIGVGVQHEGFAIMNRARKSASRVVRL